MQQSILEQGFDLLIFGMGTVFVFLTVLVFCTMAMSRAVGRWFPDAPEPLAPPAPAAAAGGGNRPVDARTLAVIEAAISQHRAKRSR